MPGRPTRNVVAAVVGAVLAAGVIVGFVRRDEAPGTRVGGAEPSLTGTAPVATVSGPDLNGGPPLTVAALRGKPVFINVWASWCLECRREGADISRFTKDHPEVVVLGIDDEARRADGVAFNREVGWTHRSIADGPGTITVDALHVASLPTTIYVDAKGIERGRTPGPVSYDMLVTVAERLASSDRS